MRCHSSLNIKRAKCPNIDQCYIKLLMLLSFERIRSSCTTRSSMTVGPGVLLVVCASFLSVWSPMVVWIFVLSNFCQRFVTIIGMWLLDSLCGDQHWHRFHLACREEMQWFLVVNLSFIEKVRKLSSVLLLQLNLLLRRHRLHRTTDLHHRWWSCSPER